jgi:hypothetical protein
MRRSACLSRDEIITRGEAATERSENNPRRHGPWLYGAKTKSGTRETRNHEYQACSIPHLLGMLVARFAVPRETLNVYAISRVMKTNLRSFREDV